MSGTSITKTEPVNVGGALTGLIAATIGVLLGFGIVHWTEVQVGLVLTLFAALIGVVTAFQRSRVTPVAAPTASVPLTPDTAPAATTGA